MSKAQYLLLAAFIGFYGLLFTFLLVRVFAAAARPRMKPAVASAPRSAKATKHRAWTTALYRNA